MGQTLMGFFEVPYNMDDPVTISVNPTGTRERSKVRCGASAWALWRPQGCLGSRPARPPPPSPSPRTSHLRAAGPVPR